MKYIVGPKVSYVSAGRVYKPGDEIDSGVFKNEKVFKAALSAGKLIELGSRDSSPALPAAGGTNTGGKRPGRPSKPKPPVSGEPDRDNGTPAGEQDQDNGTPAGEPAAGDGTGDFDFDAGGADQ
jgi:hypothetical protein